MKKGQKPAKRFKYLPECELDSEPIGTKEERDAEMAEALDGLAKAIAKSKGGDSDEIAAAYEKRLEDQKLKREALKRRRGKN